ncbi:MAG: choice-of-anchor R domain-containing protein [Verrucomicrobiota bacterium]
MKNLLNLSPRLRALRHSSLLLLAAGLAAGFPAKAAVLIGNLGEPNDTNYSVNDTGTAASFTVGGSSAVLGGITAKLNNGEIPGFMGDGVVHYHAFVYNDVASNPGSSLYDLGSFTYTTPYGTASDVTFNALTSPTLAANTTYWVVLTVDSGDYGQWQASLASKNQTGDPGWTIGDSARFVGNTFAYDSVPLFAVNAAAVPEPSTWALAGLSLLGMISWRRLGRKQVS